MEVFLDLLSVLNFIVFAYFLVNGGIFIFISVWLCFSKFTALRSHVPTGFFTPRTNNIVEPIWSSRQEKGLFSFGQFNLEDLLSVEQ